MTVGSGIAIAGIWGAVAVATYANSVVGLLGFFFAFVSMAAFQKD